MIFSKGYTRTMRAGELYEIEIFEHVADTQSDTKRMNDRQKSDLRWLNGLYIRPLGDNASRMTISISSRTTGAEMRKFRISTAESCAILCVKEK
jgi:hypothetical protein